MRLNNGGLRVKCKQCGFIFKADIDMECTSTDERNMGIECGYEGIFDSMCPNCGSETYVYLEVYEYPEGILNYARDLEKGVELMEKPEYVTQAE